MRCNFNKIIGYYRKCDLLTMLGTTISFIGIILVLNMHYTLATLCMVLSGICDAFDGTIARKNKYTKEQQVYGIELDSLSDVICFGLFPAILTAMISPFFITKIICVFYMLCGIIRLAYFNASNITDETKKGKYIGVPITTVSIIYPIVFFFLRLINFSYLSIVMPIMLFILGIAFIIRIEIKKPNVSKILKKILNKNIINYVLFPIFIIVISDLFFKLNSNTILDSFRNVINTITTNLLPFIMMVIILDSLMLILNLVFKRRNITKIIILSIFTILLLINDIKFNIMGNPLEISDINFLNPDNISMMGTATGTIGKWIIPVLLKTITMIALGIFIIILDKEQKETKEKNLYKIIKLIVGLLVLVVFALFTYNGREIIIKGIYRTNSKEILNYNSINEIYNDCGFWQGMYLNLICSNENIPEGYDKWDTMKLLREYETNESKNNWGKANVVFILSEAFSDLENIDEIKFNKPLTSNINSYEKKENCQVFDLLVPSYGGGSVNSEFEVLTGASLSFWKSGFIAYTQYYNNEKVASAPNLIKEFNNNGYETIYITPWGEASYNSKFVYGLFGADKTIYGNNLNGENKGMYYSDKSLMEDIYNELKTTSEGNYKFIMAATGQNHFPYNGNNYTEYDIEITKTKYNKENNRILKNYAQGIYDADKELNNLYEKIQNLEVPTIIVFFGDHLPYTNDSTGFNPYLSSSYFQTSDEDLNYLRQYTTKAVILANYDIDIDDLSYINASYLGAYVINQMDLDISNYFKFVDNSRTIIPVYNRTIFYKNDAIYNHNELETEMNTLKNYKYVQYGSFYDFIK